MAQSKMPNTRIKVPEQVARGEIFEIRTLIMHEMENGLRFDTTGKLIPLHIIRRFTCRYGGEEIFQVELQPGISANPYLTFCARARSTGPIEFVWEDDDGSIWRESADLRVT
jgi:thiosulfate oxidation carrier complex protein SoxZ